MLLAWVALAIAIALEVMATLSLRGLATGWHFWPILIAVLGYTASFAFMAIALRQINVGVVYAIWAGIGTVAIAIIGALLFGERLSPLGIGGIVLIIVGVAMLNLSGSAHS
jgi:small multidrug resistance pump